MFELAAIVKNVILSVLAYSIALFIALVVARGIYCELRNLFVGEHYC